MKPANCDMENGITNVQNYPLKKNSYRAETGKLKKHFLKGITITRQYIILYRLKYNGLPKKIYIYSISFRNVGLRVSQQPGVKPPPLADARVFVVVTCSLSLS